MDEYAAEFLRLSRFAPYMVSDEEKRASRFQQGLKMDIQLFLVPQQFKTYSHVLFITREIERGLEKKSKSQKHIESAKRTFQQMDREDSVRLIGAPANHSMRVLPEARTFTAKLPYSKWILF